MIIEGKKDAVKQEEIKNYMICHDVVTDTFTIKTGGKVLKVPKDVLRNAPPEGRWLAVKGNWREIMGKTCPVIKAGYVAVEPFIEVNNG